MSAADGAAQPTDPHAEALPAEPGAGDPANAGPTAAAAPDAAEAPIDEPGTQPGEASSVPPAAPTPVPHAGLRYAVLRVAMLVTVGGVLALVGMRGWLLLLTAVLVSAVLSFFVFARQREAAARNLEASLARRQAQDAQWRAAAQASKAPPPPAGQTDALGDPRAEG
jgi:hypothetical protein